MPFLTAQQVNLAACSQHCPFRLMLSVKQESCEQQFQVIGLIRLGIKPPQHQSISAKRNKTRKIDQLRTMAEQFLFSLFDTGQTACSKAPLPVREAWVSIPSEPLELLVGLLPLRRFFHSCQWGSNLDSEKLSGFKRAERRSKFEIFSE